MYTSTVPVEISGRYRSTCTAAVSCSIARLYTTIVIWNSRVEHHSSNRSTRTNRWLQHTVNVCSLAATAAGREAQRQNGEDDYCTIAKSGLLALVGRAACRGLLASPVGRVSAPSRFRLFGSRIDSQLYYLKLQARSRLSSWARAPSFFQSHPPTPRRSTIRIVDRFRSWLMDINPDRGLSSSFMGVSL